MGKLSTDFGRMSKYGSQNVSGLILSCSTKDDRKLCFGDSRLSRAWSIFDPIGVLFAISSVMINSFGTTRNISFLLIFVRACTPR